ncbi:glycosyltransferase family 4 protein [Gammaproteobacteria bacterium]|nr:glycosyltransferase family 4 protein [Gammaproteobacteria bacterium]
MNILFIHQNFPAQFKHLAPALVSLGYDVTALVLTKTEAKQWNGVKLIPYSLNRGNAKEAHPWTVDFESKVVRGEACLRAALNLKKQDYTPDVIVAHPGWGESLFLKQVWPTAKLKLYCEFFYHACGADVGFDPEYSSSDPADAGRVMLKNANMLLQFQQADAGISPTRWQASTFPQHIRDKITVIHDGMDTGVLSPDPSVTFLLDNGKSLTRDDEVITFVNRALEPYRGFHTFMRSLPILLAARPNAQVLIVGKEDVSYGAQPPEGKSWKTICSEEVLPQLTPQQRERIHFLGTIDYPRFINLLQVSRVHVYLTYPFVLSWSLLEAMSVGCSIVASDTQPLHEAIKHDETGRLVDFFDHSMLANSVTQLLDDEDTRVRLGKAARVFAIENYDLAKHCLPKQIQWLLH